jgi:hypothetical protein
MVPRLADGLGWKLLIGAFEFLQADDVWLGVAQPLQQIGQAQVDIVEGGIFIS